MRIRETPALLLKQFRASDAAGASDAPALLHDWLQRHPSDAGVRSVLARYLHSRGDVASARAQYVKVLESDPQNTAALNNLAWIYHEENDRRAIETARRAYASGPDNPAVIDTLGWLLLADEKMEEGTKLLRRAVTLAPDNPDINYHYAEALSRSGDNEEARSVLDKALASGSPFAERSAAEQLRRRLQ